MIILTADDDRLVRFAIKSILNEILGDCGDIFLEASNGNEMIQICREKKPDIAFVDIQMPFVNGLEAIEECKRCSERTEFVIVSGYSDFEYAKQGIRLGVNEYILKPVDEEQVKAVIVQLKEKLKKQKIDSNSRFQLHIMDMFQRHVALDLKEQEQIMPGREYGYLVFLLHMKHSSRDKDTAMQVQKKLLKEVRKLGEEVVARKGYFAIAVTSEGTPCMILSAEEKVQEYYMSRMKKISLTEATQEKAFYYFQWFFSNTAGDIYDLCEKLEEESYKGIQLPNGTVCQSSAVYMEDYEKNFLCLLEKLLDAWKEADGIACKEIMNTMWRRYKDKAPQIELKNVAVYCSYMTGCKISSVSFKKFCESFVINSDCMYSNIQPEESDIIEQAKAYIQRYYMKDISISEIAENFGLTANYLSTVFHRKAGMKFIDYLTKVRIDAAKKLLIQNLSASVQDIALMVGYNSARHFSTLFQKETGETPSSYRKSRV